MLNTNNSKRKSHKENPNTLFRFALLALCALIILGITYPSVNEEEKNTENSNQLLTEQVKYDIIPVQSELPIDVKGIIEAVESVQNVNVENSNKNISTLTSNEETEPETTPCVKSGFVLSDEERYVVESIVTGEAGSETYDGKWAVATCIYNACVKDGLQPSQVRKQYKYSGWNETWRTQHPEKFAEVQEVVSRVFDNGELITDKPILWFYAPKYCNGSWHNTQQYVATWGTQKFFAPW